MAQPFRPPCFYTVRRYQRFYALPATGELDPTTLDLIARQHTRAKWRITQRQIREGRPRVYRAKAFHNGIRTGGGLPGPPKVGRNDLCHCGSGKKYKRCHGAPVERAGLPPRREVAA